MTYREPSDKAKSIKSCKRTALLTKQLVPLIETCFLDHSQLAGVFVSRVCLSKEDGCVTIYISHRLGQPINRPELDIVKAYKPSIRQMVAKILCGSWTPQVAIRLDRKLGEIKRTDDLMEKVVMQESKTTYKPLEETIKDLKLKLEK